MSDIAVDPINWGFREHLNSRVYNKPEINEFLRCQNKNLVLIFRALLSVSSTYLITSNISLYFIAKSSKNYQREEKKYCVEWLVKMQTSIQVTPRR